MKKKKDKKRLNTLMALFIAVLMIGSIAGMMWSGSEDSLKYNGYKFNVVNNQISTKIEGTDYLFYYFPTDLESIEITTGVKDKIKNLEMFYLTFDPDSESLTHIDKARFDLSEELAKKEVFFINGKIKDSNDYNLPIINCDNSTEFVPVIYFKDGNRTGFFEEDNCIIAESSTKEGFLALRDIFLYNVLGVIE